LALLALDVDFTVPAHPNQFSEAARVILIAYVHSDRERRVGMSRVDTNHGKVDPSELKTYRSVTTNDPA
jgi:hypothetical protein